MNPGTFVNLEDASTTLQTAGAYSAPMFTSLYPFALITVGIIVGGILVRVLYSAVIHGVWSAAVGGSSRARRYTSDHPDMF